MLLMFSYRYFRKQGVKIINYVIANAFKKKFREAERAL